jgi:hypothetical protein
MQTLSAYALPGEGFARRAGIIIQNVNKMKNSMAESNASQINLILLHLKLVICH